MCGNGECLDCSMSAQRPYATPKKKLVLSECLKFKQAFGHFRVKALTLIVFFGLNFLWINAPITGPAEWNRFCGKRAKRNHKICAS